MRRTPTRPVYPIPPSFNEGQLEFNRTVSYLQWLEEKGATRVMTTAGTSQFNLLSVEEVYQFNRIVAKNFTGETILGIPPLSLIHLLEEIDKLNELKITNCKLLILFPERYYNDSQIIDFFEQVCHYSDYPIYIHGNPLRKGNGGTYEYTAELLQQLGRIEGFEGMKEEYSSIDLAIKEVQNIPLEIIVAGGSMRRFWSLAPHGAKSFLTGVGNFNPIHSENFFNYYSTKEYERCLNIIENIETPLFKKFMKIGWHASMRTALSYMGFLLYDRDPFVKLSSEDKNAVIEAVNKVRI